MTAAPRNDKTHTYTHAHFLNLLLCAVRGGNLIINNENEKQHKIKSKKKKKKMKIVSKKKNKRADMGFFSRCSFAGIRGFITKECVSIGAYRNHDKKKEGKKNFICM